MIEKGSQLDSHGGTDNDTSEKAKGLPKTSWARRKKKVSGLIEGERARMEIHLSLKSRRRNWGLRNIFARLAVVRRGELGTPLRVTNAV